MGAHDLDRDYSESVDEGLQNGAYKLRRTKDTADRFRNVQDRIRANKDTYNSGQGSSTDNSKQKNEVSDKKSSAGNGKEKNTNSQDTSKSNNSNANVENDSPTNTPAMKSRGVNPGVNGTAGETASGVGGAGATGASAGTSGTSAGMAGATGGASAGGTATVGTVSAGAGGVVTTGGTTAGGTAIAPIIAGVAVVLFGLLMIVGLFSYLTEGGALTLMSGWINENVLNVETDTSKFFAEFKDFLGFDGKIGFNVTEDIVIDESEYDKENEIDVGYANTLALSKQVLRNAYYKAEAEITQVCKDNGWSKRKTLDTLEEKYPNGYEDIYSDVNYGQLMNILDLGFYSDFYSDGEGWHEDLTPKHPQALQVMENKFTLNFEDADYYTYFYRITYTVVNGEEEDNTEYKENIQEGDSVESTEEDEGILTYAIPTIEPYCWNEIYEMLGIDPNDKVDGIEGLTYFELTELMLQQTKVNCSDAEDKPRTIYYTLNLGSDSIPWDYEFSSDTTNDIFTDPYIPVGGSTQDVVWKALKQAGFTDEGAAGMMGNLQAENNFRTDWVEGDQGSHGICQWRKERKTAMEDYARARGLPFNSIEAQVGYLLYELPYQCQGHYNEIKNSKNVEEATGLVARYFERCSSYSSYDNWLNAGGKYAWERYGYNAYVGRYIIDYNTRYNSAVHYYNYYK